MKKFERLSRTEMKNVMGGKEAGGITCTITVLGDDGFTETGACASDNIDNCFSYIQDKASQYNAANGYPGVNYSCS